MVEALNPDHLVFAMGAKYATGTSITVILIPCGNGSAHGVGYRKFRTVNSNLTSLQQKKMHVTISNCLYTVYNRVSPLLHVILSDTTVGAGGGILPVITDRSSGTVDAVRTTFSCSIILVKLRQLVPLQELVELESDQTACLGGERVSE